MFCSSQLETDEVKAEGRRQHENNKRLFEAMGLDEKFAKRKAEQEQKNKK